MIAARLTAQLIAGPRERDPVAVARRLVAIQAQDPRGARLAVRARSVGLRAADVDEALTAARSLVVTWLNRGTLHLIASEDYHWLHALTTPPLFTANSRRLRQEGISAEAAERGVAVVAGALAEEGPLTRQELRERIAAAGVRTEGQALVHQLALASLRGIAVRGPMAGREQAYVLVSDWLGAAPAFDRDRALAELARRYLEGHGPADERDLAKWSGLSVTDARAALTAIASQLQRRTDGLVDLARREPLAELPPPRLLGPFDPLLHGWASRGPILGGHESRVVRGGLFRPVVLVRGRAKGTWTLSGDGVALEPFERLSGGEARAVADEAQDVARYLRAG